MIIVHNTMAELETLRDANKLLRANGSLWSELPPNMSEEQLVSSLLQYADGSAIECYLTTYRHFMSACGCMGPMAGDPLCPCAMSGWLEAYRFEVAIEYLKQRANT